MYPELIKLNKKIETDYKYCKIIFFYCRVTYKNKRVILYM